MPVADKEMVLVFEYNWEGMIDKFQYTMQLDFLGVGVEIGFEDEELFREMKRRWFETKKVELEVELRIEGKEKRKHRLVSGDIVKTTAAFREGEIKPDFSYEDYVNWLVKVVLQARLAKKKILFLHAGGVVNEKGEVVAVVGESGKGKSTLVANFSPERVIGDDVVVTRKKEGQWWVERVWEKHKQGVGYQGRGKLRWLAGLERSEGVSWEEESKERILEELIKNVYWLGDEKKEYLKLSLELLKEVEVGKLRVGKSFKAEDFFSKFVF